MSKFFYKGRIEKKPKHSSCGYNTKRETKLGTETNPLTLIVNTEARQQELEVELAEQQLFATFTINADVEEDITELTATLNKPITTMFDKTPNRNDPCSCGSGKKYKKCCGK
ncbi:PBPRA1643 family SWIM/SEC-C metal-binding motif protein [Photobacterium iliopiscarium]|jgi:SWIM/SEC-C metal-binding protein|uniref:Zinc chelation protein SecC n=1 Tax=Photobacterium iliopiscarium TaxID=56192 RepID=A0A2T3ME97_9GAMM|nr:PBPRA1643 family SWIM/SEC-C metal-binding motif protein [Photobacterium iliopiscarium]KJG12397.1 zinc chelation protein SecC [Photobacterium iliopiscarium]MCD9468853.1 zinc chelation protein SecC [Photobacterium iliopiscarium]MCD9489005.1 zinc chelation protein SecC [Photobacterium iliopiscarium]MCF2245696.1 zinc chelation protein SecC [Photobacterium iliopiscarium]PST94084.1 zinc chelation protein SecC [Photobacterium iliopiscarium]